MAIYGFSGGNNLMNARLKRLEDNAPYLLRGGVYADSVSNFRPVNKTAVVDGNIDLAQGVVPGGSIPPLAVNSPFAIAKDTTNSQATIYWDGTNGSSVPVVHRADGSLAAVPPNSQLVTGLTASHWYGFLPYWANSNTCGLGWSQGDVGTPQILFEGGTGTSFTATATAAAQAAALQTQNMQGHEPLTSGFATFQMPASGTSSGGAGGGGGIGRCVMLGTDIEPLGEITARDMTITCFRETDWFRVETKSGKALNCTGNHPLYHADNGKVEAQVLKSGDWLIADLGMDKITEIHPFKRLCTKQQVSMRYGHLFWANGLLSSNVKLAEA